MTFIYVNRAYAPCDSRGSLTSYSISGCRESREKWNPKKWSPGVTEVMGKLMVHTTHIFDIKPLAIWPHSRQLEVRLESMCLLSSTVSMDTRVPWYYLSSFS